LHVWKYFLYSFCNQTVIILCFKQFFLQKFEDIILLLSVLCIAFAKADAILVSVYVTCFVFVFPKYPSWPYRGDSNQQQHYSMEVHSVLHLYTGSVEQIHNFLRNVAPGSISLREKVLCFVHNSPSLLSEKGALQILLYSTIIITNSNIVHEHLLYTSPFMQFTCINYVNYYVIL